MCQPLVGEGEMKKNRWDRPSFTKITTYMIIKLEDGKKLEAYEVLPKTYN